MVSSIDEDLKFLVRTTILVPAVMTLVCFICTVLSMTVAGFICARDREAQDESERLLQQKKEDEYVSKVLTLFYKVRTYNVFRVYDIMEEKNEERPAWCASKSEVIQALEDLGIYPTEFERSMMSRESEIFEIDSEPLFYFELERFAKTTVVYGANSMDYYACVQQDGVSFPRDFFPDTRAVFEKELVACIHKEMVEVTELFVLLLTGIDLNILRCGQLPNQFLFAQLPQELQCLEDFFYNYYLRVYPRGRTDTVVPSRTQLVPTPRPPPLPPSPLPVIEVEPPQKPRQTVELPYDDEDKENIDSEDAYSEIGSLSDVKESITRRREWSERLQKQRRRASAVYSRISQRVKKKTRKDEGSSTGTLLHPYLEDDAADMEELDLGGDKDSLSVADGLQQEYGLDLDMPDHDEEEQPPKTAVVLKDQSLSMVKVIPDEDPIPRQRPQPRLVKKPGSSRRRGKLRTQRFLEHNSFTYMIAKVIEFLRGRLVTEKQIAVKKFWKVDRNFIV